MPIRQEDLIIVDADFTNDYPPEQPLELQLPPGYRVVYAAGIPPEMMPLLLQRAKIVVDLAMPGLERISGEAILMGTIPIVSYHWNGISEQDFPGIRKVDHRNSTDISTTIDYVLRNYDKEIASVSTLRYFESIVNSWQRYSYTTDLVFSSSNYHFVLHGNNLQEENTVVLVLITVLFMFPLASIDIYVNDVIWFIRHHYWLIDLLQSSGYVRNDPMNPQEYYSYVNDIGKSFVKIKSTKELQLSLLSFFDSFTNSTRRREIVQMNSVELLIVCLLNSDIIPNWQPILILLPHGTMHGSPLSLRLAIQDLQYTETIYFLGSNSVTTGNYCSNNDKKCLDIVGLIAAPGVLIIDIIVDFLQLLSVSITTIQKIETIIQQLEHLRTTKNSYSKNTFIKSNSLVEVRRLLPDDMRNKCSNSINSQKQYGNKSTFSQENRDAITTMIDDVVYSTQWKMLLNQWDDSYIC